jgi:hypothetical protein
LFAGQFEPSTGWQFKTGMVGALIVRTRHLGLRNTVEVRYDEEAAI